MEYVGFKPLEEILEIKDVEKIKAYAQEAEARLCSPHVIKEIWNKYFELLKQEK